MPEGYPYGVQYDEQGRPFLWMPGGKKSYISPAAFGEKPPEDTTGIFRSRPQWNQKKGKWETPRDLGNILNVVVGSMLGLGVADVAFPGLFGAGAPKPYIPGGESGVLPPTLAAENISGVLSPPGIPNPLGSNAPATPPSMPFTGKLKDFFTNPKNIAGLGGIIASLVAAKKLSNPGGGGGDGAGGNEFLTPEMRRYQAQSEARFRRTDPLHEAISQLAFQRLPLQAREGLSLPRVPLPPQG